MNDGLINAIEEAIAQKIGDCKVVGTTPISGGCINDAKRLQTTAGDFFIKANSAVRFPRMFEAEAKGLSLLRSANEIYVPEVITYGEYGGQQFLITEFVEAERSVSNFWEDFGISLARLHRHSNTHFGLDHDNYIGSLNQSNTQADTWADFFVESRLQPQIEMARDKSLIDNKLISHFEGLYQKLPNIFPQEPPALLHGDLWSGNFMVSTEGKACIIDPAVYYGHREMDIAMTRLFGGFGLKLYSTYNEEYPMEKAWETRMDICNLYPLLVHVNLFGSSYVSQVESIIKRF